MKILEGEMAKMLPVTVLKWQLYRMDSRTGLCLVSDRFLSPPHTGWDEFAQVHVQLARYTCPPDPGLTFADVRL